MHVAFTIPELGGGGTETVVLNLAGELIRRGHRVDIVLLRATVQRDVPDGTRLFVADGGTADPGEAELHGTRPETVRAAATSGLSDWMRAARALKCDPLCLPSTRLARLARAMACYLESEQPDCVLPNIPRAQLATLLAGRLLMRHPPVVPVIHNLVRRHRRRQRHLAGDAARFICVSHGIAAHMAAAVRVPRDRITTIYNPVVTPDLYARAAEPPAHPWLADGGLPVVVAAGHLEERKDFATLIRAFALVASRRACRLVILGEGGLRPRLETLVRRLGLAGRVSLPGWIDNPFALFARASLFVLSSVHEGLPTVLIEALACGCPCVSTDCPAGPAEILRDGSFGPLVPVGDEAALADAMDRVLEQPPDKARLERRGADFSAQRAGDAYERLIGGLVERTRASAVASEQAACASS